MKAQLLTLFLLTSFFACSPKIAQWETLDDVTGEPVARHEAGLVAVGEKLYLLGGRRVNPTSIFDTKTSTWTQAAAPPLEIHHFQPVVWHDEIYVLGAMTGGWPNETPLDRILKYNPTTDTWTDGATIPAGRRRGGAGVVIHQDKFYLVGGITEGHMGGYVPWFDEYDPATGTWRILPDAPFPRDHFQAAVTGGKLYAFAGRTTSRRTGEDMTLTLSHGNVYDFAKGEWEQTMNHHAIPTERAGNFVFVHDGRIVVAGGESGAQVAAHAEVETFDPLTQSWAKWTNLQRGRHGTGFAQIGNYLYTASGCGNRGGEPELISVERYDLSRAKKGQVQLLTSADIRQAPVYQQYHSVEIDLNLAATQTEFGRFDAAYSNVQGNPFMDFRMEVEFVHEGGETKTVRGYFAADGTAGETGADRGNIWRVRFRPDKTGYWRANSTLRYGIDLAIKELSDTADTQVLRRQTDEFQVIPSHREAPDFRARGPLTVENGYFKFRDSDDYLLKVGTNSPENLLAYYGFDGTYRTSAATRDGESKTDTTLHRFAPHAPDWRPGDPTWGDGQGKELIGAINYLAERGMNSVYFLTMNINGDGKDVWPYVAPDDFTRFDVSKLEQWNVLFEHMQRRGILLHIVLQETENEGLLDGGNLGPERKLYLLELIARFGHHNGLIWNLGEENGPTPWADYYGQNDAQRRATAEFIKAHDPYQHPLVLHTLPANPERGMILDSIADLRALDGISLQHSDRWTAPETVREVRERARRAGHEWAVSMDEIGMWHTGALTDTADVNHPTLVRHALWGTLLNGAAGVEWYFGGMHVHNDLASEDWRQRDRLWELTSFAHQFFEEHLPYWEMTPAPERVRADSAFCLVHPAGPFALYVPDFKAVAFEFSTADAGTYDVWWFDPFAGGELQRGTVKTVSVTGAGFKDLGLPPGADAKGRDWVILLSDRSETD